MKIRQIDLWNFRQFYERQTLKLACDDDRNVTLIHAENGVGKTTLLNAVYWSMFGEVTPRFEQKQRIVNFEAEREGVDQAQVEVEFEFNEQDYLVSRRFRSGGRNTDFRVSAIDRGSLTPLKAPETFINSVIPKPMARYFFFDGEHAESFAGEQNQTAGAAIRSMLGCDLAEDGITDLKAVAAQFTKLMSGASGDEEVEKLKEKLSELEEAQARDEAALADHRKAVDQAIEQKALIDEALRRTAGAKEIQELRDQLQTSKANADRDLLKAEADVVRWIGEKSIAAVSRKLRAETLDFLDSETLEGRLPSPYREDFIQSLLHRENCICCRDLRPQSSEWAAVSALLKTAGNAEAESRVSRARVRLQSLQETARHAPGQLAMAQERVASLTEQRRSLEQRLGEASRKLEAFNVDEVREREAARIELDKQIRDRSRQAGDLEGAIKRRTNEIASLAHEIEVKTAKNVKAQAILRKRNLALRGAARLQEHLAAYEREAREEIEREINAILERTARRDYRFSFANDFTMSLTHSDVDGPVPKSGGENQLMSLAFTAALVRFSKARVGVQHEILSPGTVAPLVLDAPIGHLDHAYRRATAAFIPEMAGQVVLLLSSAHLSDGVLDALKPRIGKEYVLISENRRPQNGKGDDAISLNGRTYIRSLFNQERNRTRIEQVA